MHHPLEPVKKAPWILVWQQVNHPMQFAKVYVIAINVHVLDQCSGNYLKDVARMNSIQLVF